MLLLIRHGRTVWNEQGRIQGRRDLPLSDRGRAEVEGWRLPEAAQAALWICSPLLRARQTAALLHGAAVASEPRLIETDWGDWEGLTLAQMRAAGGAGMAENESKGLDFQPPGGESPRRVQERLAPLLKELARRGEDVVAVTHKGVIRAIYALASGWDMRERPKVALRRDCAQRFVLRPCGTPEVAALNQPLNQA